MDGRDGLRGRTAGGVRCVPYEVLQARGDGGEADRTSSSSAAHPFAPFSTSSSPTPRFNDNIAHNASLRFANDYEGGHEQAPTTNYYAQPVAPAATPPHAGRPSQAPRRSFAAGPQQASSSHSVIKPMPIRRVAPLAQPATKSTAPSRFAPPPRLQGFDQPTTSYASMGGGYKQPRQFEQGSSHELFRQEDGEEEYWEDEPGWGANGSSNQQGGRGGTSWEDALMAHNGPQRESASPDTRQIPVR